MEEKRKKLCVQVTFRGFIVLPFILQNWQRVIRDVMRRGNARISGKSANKGRKKRTAETHIPRKIRIAPLGSESVPDLLERFATGANLLVASAAHTFPSTC